MLSRFKHTQDLMLRWASASAQWAEVPETHWRWTNVSGKMAGLKMICVWKRQKTSLGSGKTALGYKHELGPQAPQQPSPPQHQPSTSPSAFAWLCFLGVGRTTRAAQHALSAVATHKPNRDTNNRALVEELESRGGGRQAAGRQAGRQTASL